MSNIGNRESGELVLESSPATIHRPRPATTCDDEARGSQRYRLKPPTLLLAAIGLEIVLALLLPLGRALPHGCLA